MLLGLITLTMGILNFTQPAALAASVFTVNSTGDGADSNTADNLCNDGTGNCTLRAAVEQANATAGADTIGFSVRGTINLTGALPDIIDNLTINGPGSSLLTVRRDTGGDYRIFNVDREESRNTLVVSINGLTVANGRTPDGFAHAFGGGGGGGGGVANGGTLTLTDVTLTGNRTGNGGSIGAGTAFGGPGGPGGAVYNFGTLTMTNVTLTGNSTGVGGEGFTASDGGGGGAVLNFGGMLTMNGCVVRGNSTGGGGRSNNSGGRGGDGGGVYSFFGTMTMSNCVVSENMTGAGGNSSGTGGTGGRGGNGAGIYASHGQMLTGVSVSNNVAGGGGNASLGTPGGGGQGGGIYFDSGIGVLANSTVSGNAGSGGSAIYNNESNLSVTNNTVSGNRLSGPGGAVRGGAITNCTITANEGPGLIVGALVRNSIIAGNGGGTGPDVSGSFSSQGHNLVGDVGDASGFNVAGDQVGTSAAPINARLGPLADNGGPTLTHALLAGSPALDAGDNALALDKDNNPLTTDQRGAGFPRRADAADADTAQTVDIGAFEAHPSVEDVVVKTTSRNTPLSFSFNVGDAALGVSSVTAASNNQTLVPDANLSLSGSGSARTLLITPNANLSGTAIITLTVTGSNGRTATDAFVFGVDASNTPPVFTKGADQTAPEDSGPQTIAGWATGIGPGSAGEAGQSVSFVVKGNTNPGLFSAAPSVSPNGTLTFTPAPEAIGSAAVTLVLKDDGGTADGGQDTSAPQTFNINVTAVNDAPVNSLPPTQRTPPGTRLVFSGPNGLSVADVDAGTGIVRLTLSATHGTLRLNGTGGLTFFVGEGRDDVTMTFTGTLVNVNAALDGMSFRAEQGFTGAASIQLTTDDQGNTGSGGAKTDTDTLTVNVTDVSPGTLLIFPPLDAFESAGTLTFRVGRAFGDAGAVSVNYSTSGGTAVSGAACGAGVDYVNASGTLDWADGDKNDKTFTVTLCDDSLHEPDKTFIVSLSNVTGGANIGISPVTVTISDDDQPTNRIEFSQAVYTAAEGSGSTTVTVMRTGNTGAAAGVDYATDPNGSLFFVQPCSQVSLIALDRCDFTTAAGHLLFAPGETEKTFQILLSDDSYIEQTEMVFVRLSNPSGGFVLGARAMATLEIIDDAQESSANPIDDSAKFVRQHYHDFLNREPDAAGLAFWTNEIDKCGADAQCKEVKKINVSAAFFLSIEFQETGYLVERTYKTAFGDTSSLNVPGTVPVVRLQEFLPDSQRIGRGVQVGIGDWEAQLEANKQAYMLDFITRQRFLNAFPSSMSSAQFVDKLNQNSGGALSQAERGQLVAELAGSPDQTQGRASVLRKVAEDADLRNGEKNRAFVLMQFYGYLRRNPDDPQDTDFRGWKFWLDKLNEFNGNFIQAEMVKAFLNSDEYRKRFGQ